MSKYKTRDPTGRERADDTTGRNRTHL